MTIPLCIVHKGFKGLRAGPPKIDLGGNLIDV